MSNPPAAEPVAKHLCLAALRAACCPLELLMTDRANDPTESITQRELARITGLHTRHIINLESGHRRMTPHVAALIAAATGAAPKSLLDPNGVPLGLAGQKFTRDTFLLHRGGGRKESAIMRAAATDDTVHAQALLQQLFTAALTAGCFRETLVDFQHWAAQLAEARGFLPLLIKPAKTNRAAKAIRMLRPFLSDRALQQARSLAHQTPPAPFLPRTPHA